VGPTTKLRRRLSRFGRPRQHADAATDDAATPRSGAAATAEHQDDSPAPRAEAAAPADDAELDALRGELVRELNRLAERSRHVD
jgi:hypothetical protein